MVDYGSNNRTRFRYLALTTSAVQTIDDATGTVVRSIGTGWGGELLLDWDSTGSDIRIYGLNAHHDLTWTAGTSGAVTGTVRYDPAGAAQSVTGSVPDFRFQSSWADDTTELSWVVTRWYAPAQGRFISEDSLLGEPRDPDSRHLYAYGAGDPVGAWDPDGRLACALLLFSSPAGPPSWAAQALCWAAVGAIALAAIQPVQVLTSELVRQAEKALRSGRRVEAKCVVIGEKQRDRVIPRAVAYGCDWYGGFGVGRGIPLAYRGLALVGMTDGARHLAFLGDNEAWIKSMVRKAMVVIDIGPDFSERMKGKRKVLSPYYYMEYSVASRLPNYIYAWDHPWKGIWSDLPSPRRYEW